MGKATGLGDNFYVAGYDLSGDVGAVTDIGGGFDPLEVTGINKSAIERLGGKRDGRASFMSFFNDANDAEHEALAGLVTTDRIVSYFKGEVVAGHAASLTAKQISYDPTRGVDGSLTFNVQAQANGYGLEWGTQLTDGRRQAVATENGTGVDFAASSDFGLQAYLHVFAVVGNIDAGITVKLQESSDNAVGDPYADVTGGAFAIVDISNPPPKAQRIETARGQTIERWLRCVATLSGTITSADYAVMVVKNDVSVVF